MRREFAMLPDNFREVRAALPELSRLDRLRFQLQTFWITKVEGNIEYIFFGWWIKDLRYWLAHRFFWGAILFWNDAYNNPYRFWYKDVPADMRVLLTDIARWNFKQRLAFLIGTTVKGWR